MSEEGKTLLVALVIALAAVAVLTWGLDVAGW